MTRIQNSPHWLGFNIWLQNPNPASSLCKPRPPEIKRRKWGVRGRPEERQPSDPHWGWSRQCDASTSARGEHRSSWGKGWNTSGRLGESLKYYWLNYIGAPHVSRCQNSAKILVYFVSSPLRESTNASSPSLYLTAGPKTFLAISGHHSGQLKLMTSFRDLSTSESPGIVFAIAKSPQTRFCRLSKWMQLD